MKPLNDYVLIDIGEEKEVNENGVYVPKSMNNTGSDILKKGTVLAVGGSVKIDIDKSNIVYFNKHAITKVPEHNNLVLVRSVDIYLVI